MEKLNAVFESYNMAVEESFNKFFDQDMTEEVYRYKQENLETYMNLELKKWEDTPISSLNGLTPKEYFSNLSDFEEIVEHVKQAATLCDEEIPQLLSDRFKSFGEGAVDVLIDLAADSSLRSDEDNFLVSLTAINLLGEWEIEKAVGPLIDILCNSDDEDDAILEGVERALANLGTAAIQPIIHTLQGVQTVGYVHENLVSALSTIGRKNPSEDIFRCLKNSFLKMDNKVIGAMCLADYGDGRAIPALRGYVSKNMETIDAETYYQIKAAVEGLGGNMDDLEVHFGE